MRSRPPLRDRWHLGAHLLMPTRLPVSSPGCDSHPRIWNGAGLPGSASQEALGAARAGPRVTRPLRFPCRANVCYASSAFTVTGLGGKSCAEPSLPGLRRSR